MSAEKMEQPLKGSLSYGLLLHKPQQFGLAWIGTDWHKNHVAKVTYVLLEPLRSDILIIMAWISLLNQNEQFEIMAHEASSKVLATVDMYILS